jgi:hypothetical protein
MPAFAGMTKGAGMTARVRHSRAGGSPGFNNKDTKDVKDKVRINLFLSFVSFPSLLLDQVRMVGIGGHPVDV